jgi:hypothetical protein
MLIDDLDGSAAEGTVRFGLDGTEYEIDLNARHAKELRKALARYLDVDWPWIQERCRRLAQVGTAGLLRPRSRHISTAGVDTACSYLGQSGLAHA